MISKVEVLEQLTEGWLDIRHRTNSFTPEQQILHDLGNVRYMHILMTQEAMTKGGYRLGRTHNFKGLLTFMKDLDAPLNYEDQQLTLLGKRLLIGAEMVRTSTRKLVDNPKDLNERQTRATHLKTLIVTLENSN